MIIDTCTKKEIIKAHYCNIETKLIECKENYEERVVPELSKGPLNFVEIEENIRAIRELNVLIDGIRNLRDNV